jgi:hypothetical protein
LAALLSGASVYRSLDAVAYTSTAQNVTAFAEMVALFRERAAIPSTNEFPEMLPNLPTYEFPRHILSDEMLAVSLRSERIDAIRGRCFSRVLLSGSVKKQFAFSIALRGTAPK